MRFGTPPTQQQGQLGQQGAPTGGPGGFGGTGGAGGGLLNGSESTATITRMLQDDADQYTWVAAAVGSNSASGYQLASEEPVMAIGGFNGSDPSPTLAQFQQYVAEGRIHYFIGSGGFGGGNQMGGSNASSEIATWVSENFTAQTVDGVTIYDLTAGATTGTDSLAPRRTSRSPDPTPRSPPRPSTWSSRSTTRRPTSRRRCCGSGTTCRGCRGATGSRSRTTRAPTGRPCSPDGWRTPTTTCGWCTWLRRAAAGR